MSQITDQANDDASFFDKSKHLLVICRTAPYGNSLAREAVETALAAGAIGVNVAMLFMDEGVWQLIDNRDTDMEEGRKNHSAAISALPIYDVRPLLADKDSLTRRGIDVAKLAKGIEIIEARQVKECLNNYEMVLSF